MSQTKRIEKLTPAQEKRIPEYRDRFLAAGLCTDPADRPRAEAAIDKVYEVAGLVPPREKIWCDSPLQGAFAAAALEYITEAKGPINKDAWEAIQERAKSQTSSACYGQHDASWLSFYAYFRDVCKLKECDNLSPLIEMSECCGWFWPFDSMVILTERPNVLCRDEENRLHKDGSAALSYPDGFSIYCWHGTRLPERMGTTLSEHWESKWLLEEKNAELRRVLIRGIGYDRILHDLKSKRIAKSGDMEIHRITKSVDVEDIILLKYVCPSTDDTYITRIPPGIKDCEEGRRWTMHDENMEVDFLQET